MAAILNAVWITTVVLGSLLFAWVFSFSPALAIVVFAGVIVFLAASLGPGGYLLDLLAQRVEMTASSLRHAVLRSMIAACIYALGALAVVSMVGIGIAATLSLPPTLAVAMSLFGAWLIVMALEWFVVVIGLTGEETLSLSERAHQALMIVLTRPGFSLAVLAVALIFIVTIVILLPGPSGAGLLVRRAAVSRIDAGRAEELDRSFAKRNFRSLLFPWKGR